jgi:hypothetical protein
LLLFASHGFSEVFKWYKEHPETFTFLLSHMFMVHLMCFPQSPEIDVVCAGKPLKPLMNKNIMNQKISNTIQGDSYADVKHKPVTFNEVADTKEKHRYTGKHHKEIVVFFKEMWCFVMVIFMQVPEKTVHNILMCKPGYTFHQAKSDYYYSNIK